MSGGWRAVNAVAGALVASSCGLFVAGLSQHDRSVPPAASRLLLSCGRTFPVDEFDQPGRAELADTPAAAVLRTAIARPTVIKTPGWRLLFSGGGVAQFAHGDPPTLATFSARWA